MTPSASRTHDVPDPQIATAHAERRLRLRKLLTAKRAALAPEALGLPRGPRRRVAGLRCEEVAELIGVSNEWYRWFESGRTQRVSQQFLARLAVVLQLTPSEQVALYRFALPELYEAEAAAHEEASNGMSETLRLLGAGPPAQPLTVSVRSPLELAEAVRLFSVARERFLTDGELPSVALVRPRIVASWKRSVEHRVQPQHVKPRNSKKAADSRERWRAQSGALMHAGAAVIAALGSILGDSGYAIALADAGGHILVMAGDETTCARIHEVDRVLGGDWTEAVAGTNAIGTVLVDARPVQLVGPEHLRDDCQDMTCTAAPIRDYLTGTMAGVLVITGRNDVVRPELTALVSQHALEIEEELASRGST